MTQETLIEAIEALKVEALTKGHETLVVIVNAKLDQAINLIRQHQSPAPVETKGNRAFADREWTDEEGRLWTLLDFGYGTPSDIRLQLRLGAKFDTTEYVVSPAPVASSDEMSEVSKPVDVQIKCPKCKERFGYRLTTEFNNWYKPPAPVASGDCRGSVDGKTKQRLLERALDAVLEESIARDRISRVCFWELEAALDFMLPYLTPKPVEAAPKAERVEVTEDEFAQAMVDIFTNGWDFEMNPVRKCATLYRYAIAAAGYTITKKETRE